MAKRAIEKLADGLAKLRIANLRKKAAKSYAEALDALAVEVVDVVFDSTAAPKPQQSSFGFDSTHGFVGEEFLLWLWFRCDNGDGEFRLRDSRVVGVAIDDLLQFAPKHEDDVEQTLRHGMPTRSAEARAGLRSGNRIGRARVLIAEGAMQFGCTIDGETMALCAVRLPEDAEEAENAADRTADRAGNWITAQDIVGELFAVFLRARTRADWLKTEGAAIAAWMRQ